MNDTKLDVPVIIVSGLPRSGTSLMMQMLEACGVPLLSDQLRQPDENNPRGYHEYEPVKKLATENRWLEQAGGKAVKIILQLLPFLPEQLPVQVLLLDRDIQEVVRSQELMLERMGMKALNFPGLAETFAKQQDTAIKFLQQRPRTQYLKVAQKHLINKDPSLIHEILTFLNLPFENVERMLNAVDPALNRVRVSK